MYWYSLQWAPPTQSCFLLETYSEFDSNWGSAPSSIGWLGMNDITAEHMLHSLKHFWDCGCVKWGLEKCPTELAPDRAPDRKRAPLPLRPVWPSTQHTPPSCTFPPETHIYINCKHMHPKSAESLWRQGSGVLCRWTQQPKVKNFYIPITINKREKGM